MKRFEASLIFVGMILCSTSCFDIVLHECAHDAEGQTFSNNVWTTFDYEYQVENGSDSHLVPVRLKAGQISCLPGDVSHKISVNFLDEYNKLGFDGEMYGRFEDSGNDTFFKINEVGILSFIADPALGLEEFSKESYCIRRVNETYSSLEICCGGSRGSCIRKCCPFGYAFTNNMSDPCKESLSWGWTLPKLTSKNGTGHEVREVDMYQSKIHTGFPNCQIVPYNLTDVLFSFRMMDDLSLKIMTGEASPPLKWETIPDNVGYCVDSLPYAMEDISLKCSKSQHDVLLLCREPYIPKATPKDWTYRMIYICGFCVSIFFLLVTATVHIILWEKQNIHALTILCYVLTLTGFYICLLVIHLDETRKRFSNPYTSFVPEEFCPTLGIITHFMGVFSFAWLSVINFDLWWTFRILKPMNQRSFDYKRLLCYAGFAFAVPIAVVSSAIALQISYMKQSKSCPKEEEDHTIYPRYGEDSCFLTNSSRPYYFYLPVGFLLLANLIFYLCTSCQMLRIYNATRRISSESTARKQKQSCKLFLKLFLVMGITWISQVVLSLVESGDQTWYSPIFTVLDLVNMFQAIAIFVIFVCKRETLRALEQKSPCFKPLLLPFRGYFAPTVLGRSTDGSYKMSRTELTKHNSIESSSGSDHYRHHRRNRDSELISFS